MFVFLQLKFAICCFSLLSIKPYYDNMMINYFVLFKNWNKISLLLTFVTKTSNEEYIFWEHTCMSWSCTKSEGFFVLILNAGSYEQAKKSFQGYQERHTRHKKLHLQRSTIISFLFWVLCDFLILGHTRYLFKNYHMICDSLIASLITFYPFIRRIRSRVLTRVPRKSTRTTSIIPGVYMDSDKTRGSRGRGTEMRMRIIIPSDLNILTSTLDLEI